MKLLRFSIQSEMRTLNFHFKDSLTLLISPNGIGKTTTLLALEGLLCYLQDASRTCVLNTSLEYRLEFEMQEKVFVAYCKDGVIAMDKEKEFVEAVALSKMLGNEWGFVPIRRNILIDFFFQKSLTLSIDEIDFVNGKLSTFWNNLTGEDTLMLKGSMSSVSDGALFSLNMKRDRFEIPLDNAAASTSRLIDVVSCIAIASLKAENTIALIDEIERHLDIGVQEKLIDALTKTFPNCYIVASTHSPCILMNFEENVISLND